MISDYVKKQGQDYQKLHETANWLSSEIHRRKRRESFIALPSFWPDSGRAFGPADCGRGQAQANGLVPASSAAGEAVQPVRSISPA
jgi:hypothetical protein